jgi:hypothetical protein
MAEAELQDAAAWYDERSPGPGLRFGLAVRNRSDEIDEIEIVAVAHFKRRASFWSGR